MNVEGCLCVPVLQCSRKSAKGFECIHGHSNRDANVELVSLKLVEADWPIVAFQPLG